MKYKMLLLVFFTTVTWHAQTVSQKLDAAVHKLLSNSVAQSASLSFFVADKNGKMIYEYQPNTGL
ncbi:MAG TPA: D-alanyl-D-alanine carboxypeptidase/D-alanyl-D-alanine-endopeptidase, partial [Chryseobacterium sp.]|nr:D-alanyl-D-alanine carboxypeptidase/D-alanyl-D-alanine-endopeptidase [Chryseobacterium sp.]